MDDPGGCAKLAATLGREFARPELLVEALTHSSAATGGARSLERLEFLGDRVLGLAVAAMLIRRFPDEDPGALARRLARLVSRDSLAKVADGLGLAGLVAMQPPVDAAALPRSVRGDACEAVIGAVFLDGGLDAAAALVERLWAPLVTAAPPREAKTELQEWAQGRGLPLPVYDTVAVEGPAHEPVFTVRAAVAGLPAVEASGASKRAAEQDAADALLRRIRDG